MAALRLSGKQGQNSATSRCGKDQLAAARGDIALSLISLYRALGGGWEMRLARGDGPCPATTMGAPTTLIEQVPPPPPGNAMPTPATWALTPPLPATVGF